MIISKGWLPKGLSRLMIQWYLTIKVSFMFGFQNRAISRVDSGSSQKVWFLSLPKILKEKERLFPHCYEFILFFVPIKKISCHYFSFEKRSSHHSGQSEVRFLFKLSNCEPKLSGYSLSRIQTILAFQVSR